MSHGSRDPRPQLELEKLAAIFSSQLKTLTLLPLFGNKRQIIAVGTLELGPISLHEQLYKFGQQVRSLNISKIQVIPLFLLPGVHVKEDIPAEIAIATQNLTAEKDFNHGTKINQMKHQIKFNLCPHLGSHPKIIKLLSRRISPLTADNWVLLSHGSRRPGANEPVEKIALLLQRKCQVSVHTAYWSVPPDIKYLVKRLVEQGHQNIGILPYFLFHGGIIDAIAQVVNELGQKYPSVQFHWTEPLGATEELAELIVELIQ
ncbi:MAG: sirohydrochlorin chelatase [Microcoleaceae cyanobacterium MO_207.B10]|nr:sirohydrochlorin chelatase [Microcoleaceae cyanobacterium MO_207.B10]